MTATEIITGVLFLNAIKTDYQLDRTNLAYLGFVKIGIEQLKNTINKEAFIIIINNKDFFQHVIDELGLKTEGPLNLEETIFTLK